MTEEIWKKIEGTNYSISNEGRFRNDKTGYITYGSDKNGYCSVKLGKHGKDKLVHDLVAMAFPDICGEYFEGAQVDHRDGNKKNNRATNLRWVTGKENCNNYTTLQKLCKRVMQFDKNGLYETDYLSYSEASQAFGLKSKYSIWKVLNHYGRLKSYKGKVFVYRDDGYYDLWRLFKSTIILENAFSVREMSEKNGNNNRFKRTKIRI